MLAWIPDVVAKDDQRTALQWCHHERDGVSNHQPHDCLLNRLFRRRSKKTSKHCVTGLCVGNLPMTSEFSAQRASDAENVSIWWRHHGINLGTQIMLLACVNSKTWYFAFKWIKNNILSVSPEYDYHAHTLLLTLYNSMHITYHNTMPYSCCINCIMMHAVRTSRC